MTFPHIRVKWPADTVGQLAAFRSEFCAAAILSFFLGYGMVIYSLHHNPALSHLLGIIVVGSLLGCWLTIGKPTNPFRVQLSVPRPLTDLDESALRVLSFLKSSEAKVLRVMTALVTATLVFSVTIFDWAVIQGMKEIPWERDRNVTISYVIVTALVLYVVPLYFVQEAGLHVWLDKRFDKILTKYEPWPRDKPF